MRALLLISLIVHGYMAWPCPEYRGLRYKYVWPCGERDPGLRGGVGRYGVRAKKVTVKSEPIAPEGST